MSKNKPGSARSVTARLRNMGQPTSPMSAAAELMLQLPSQAAQSDVLATEVCRKIGAKLSDEVTLEDLCCRRHPEWLDYIIELPGAKRAALTEAVRTLQYTFATVGDIRKAEIHKLSPRHNEKMPKIIFLQKAFAQTN
jgi:hypothetical protein